MSTKFSRDAFEPWETFRTPLFLENGQEIGGGDGVRTYYHAWQIFEFAAFLRSGLTVQIGRAHV